MMLTRINGGLGNYGSIFDSSPRVNALKDTEINCAQGASIGSDETFLNISMTLQVVDYHHDKRTRLVMLKEKDGGRYFLFYGSEDDTRFLPPEVRIDEVERIARMPSKSMFNLSHQRYIRICEVLQVLTPDVRFDLLFKNVSLLHHVAMSFPAKLFACDSSAISPRLMETVTLPISRLSQKDFIRHSRNHPSLRKTSCS